MASVKDNTTKAQLRQISLNGKIFTVLVPPAQDSHLPGNVQTQKVVMSGSKQLAVHKTNFINQAISGQLTTNQNNGVNKPMSEQVAGNQENNMQRAVKKQVLAKENIDVAQGVNVRETDESMDVELEPQVEQSVVDTVKNESASFTWTQQPAKLFFELYRKYKKDLDSRRLHTKKALFSAIAKEMRNENYKVTDDQVETRFKTLERSAKNHISDQKKTGRARKTLQYEDEIMEMFVKRPNVTPLLTLDTNVLDNLEERVEVREEVPLSESSPLQDRSKTPMRKRHGKTAVTLDGVREELSKQNKLFEERVEVLKNQHAEFVALYRERNAMFDKANKLREERNELLKKLVESQEK